MGDRALGSRSRAEGGSCNSFFLPPLLCLTIEAGKREGGPGTDGGTHKGTSSSMSNPSTHDPSRNGKTLGAENDAPELCGQVAL